MTKQSDIALVAVALFVLLAVMPASAVTTTGPFNPNGTQLDLGATVFIGEQNLNLTHALNAAVTGGPTNIDQVPQNLTIGWWASAAAITGATASAPTKTINLAGGRYSNFEVTPSDFVGYTGNWYLLMADGTTAQTGIVGTPVAVINVQDPTLSVAAWDFVQQKDVTGQSVPQGTHLGVQINTNMYAATYNFRNNTVWTYPIGQFAALPGSYNVMPNGNPSVWGDTNFTGALNGSYVYTAVPASLVPGGLPANMLYVRNYTNATVAYNVYQLVTNERGYTPAATPVGNYAQEFFNNSAVDDNYPWTGQNFTMDAAGLQSQEVADQGLNAAFPSGGWSPEVMTTNTFVNARFWPWPATDGFITIKVKDEAGATLDHLYVGVTGAYNSTSIVRQFVTTQPWTFGTADTTTGPGYWVTDALDTNNQYAYPVGTYSIWAESNLNNMKDNYKNAGADYTGKTVSATGTITLVSDTVKIEANKDSVVRSKSFSVTVTGKPATQYFLWVKGTSAMDGTYDNQAPMVNIGQDSVDMDDAIDAGIGIHPIGDYPYENGAGSTIWSDVPPQPFNRTRYYASVTTGDDGTGTVEFITNNWTKAQKYTIRVEQTFGTDIKSDEVDINVEKGAVTIVAAGDQSYYLGEEIKFSGTNTETYKTYLFLIGPNLPSQGAKINDPDPRYAGTANPGITNNVIADFKAIDVNGDNTWSWKWGTANYALDAGTYTIYAVSQPYDKNHLANSAYGTVSIIIKKPFVSATASQSTVAKGDRLYVTGTAEGDPNSVQIWIMGKNYAVKDSASVNSDASFKYEVKQETTKTLSSGQYFVVVQHPMQNKVFDVDTFTTGNNDVWVVNKQLIASGATINTANFTKIFKLLGSGSLQGSDAAEALAQGINDANVDDTYTKLQFLVEEPIIRVDAIGDKHVGDKFTITAQTNLAVDDEVLVQVYSSSFKPTEKSQSGEFSGATGTIKVTKGDSGMNKLSFDVDSSTFKPDEYIVTEDAVLQVATGTALFNVLETSAPTVAPTAVVTAAPTVVQTAVPTTVATAAPTATPTKSPGFGALIALIGLGAVAFVVVRRH